MRYIPTTPDGAPPTSPAAAVARAALRELRLEAERRAWAGRVGLRVPRTGDAAVDAAAERLSGLLAELRAVTTRYVCALRAEGARPEQMLVQVKGFVREAMSAEGWQDPDAVRMLTAEVVSWSIAAYYDV